MARADREPFSNPLRAHTTLRREDLRAALWVVPVVEVVLAVALFVLTYALDRAVDRGDFAIPGWIDRGSADAGRQVLIGIAAAVITVVGVVFSITIVALTLASTQFGPRIIRTFMRDRGTQFTLGTFVATFVYSILALGAITTRKRGDFVPHISISVALALVLVDLGVLIYFIDHVGNLIQLPRVMAGIARDLSSGIETAMVGHAARAVTRNEAGMSVGEIRLRVDTEGATVAAPSSGYLQTVRHDELVRMASRAEAVVELLHRPGHFVIEGRPLARVWPAGAAADVQRRLSRAHAIGPHRTLSQDIAFAIDQLVEIALRALSPAVNDTFTGLTCVDWLTDGLCRISSQWNPEPIHRDRYGHIRLIEAELSYQGLVDRAFDKIRQAAITLPAVLIRQLDAIAKILESTRHDSQRDALMAQARMIVSTVELLAVLDDREAVLQRFARVVATLERVSSEPVR